MTTTTLPQRRTVRFENLDEIVEDVERLVGEPNVTLGNWTFGQILDHLSKTMENSYKPVKFRAPWPIRFVARTLKRRFLTRPMKPGFNLPKAASYLLPNDGTVDETLPRLRLAVERLKSEAPEEEHEVFGHLTHEEWTLLHLRHAELHLSFVVPERTSG